VAGTVEDVEKPLQNASRSSPGTLAWLRDAVTGEAICVNPIHVVLLAPTQASPGHVV
jgi:hypothetical protein